MSLSQNSPIGIFDSGIGGMTVAKAITRLLPDEQIVYFGDTAHLPYGDKSAESITHYAENISDFLIEKGCKIIVIACNTASAVAWQGVCRHVGSKVQVINVIDPVVKYVAENYKHSKIGVIGTKGTINSRVYARRIAKKNKTISVTSLATPLLAPMIEEGFFNNYISQTIINSYLSKNSILNINALILGCTHYPLIKKEVQAYYKGKVEIIDSADIVGRFIKSKLTASSLLSLRKKHEHHFYVSDFTKAFEKSTRIFFGKRVRLKEVNQPMPR